MKGGGALLIYLVSVGERLSFSLSQKRKERNDSFVFPRGSVLRRRV